MRINFIDNSKAIAILLVIVGHTDGIPQILKCFIFSFHMPAFFFISGYLLKINKFEMKFLSFTKEQFRKLIVPYFFFGMISILYSITKHTLTGLEFNIYSALNGFTYGNSEGLVNITLWFFTCLFSTSIISFLLFKKFTSITIVCFSFVLGLGVCFFHSLIPFRPPWNMDLSIVSLFFYSLGHLVAQASDRNSQLTMTPYRMVLLLIGTAALLYLANKNGRVDMAFMVFRDPLLFFLNACIGVALLLVLSFSIPVTLGALFLSKNTIILFPLHPIFFSIFTGIGMIVFTVPHDFQISYYWSVIYTCGAIAFCYPISIIFTKFFPFVIGKRKEE